MFYNKSKDYNSDYRPPSANSPKVLPRKVYTLGLCEATKCQMWPQLAKTTRLLPAIKFLEIPLFCGDATVFGVK